jgi:hypothetical protein
VITPEMQALIDAPLADATKVNLPAGRRSAPRAKKAEYADEIGCPKLKTSEVRARKQKAEDEKLGKLFDYYAGTDLTAEKIAEHMGLYRNDETGVDDKGKPTFTRVLDVRRAQEQIEWRRRKAA